MNDILEEDTDGDFIIPLKNKCHTIIEVAALLKDDLSTTEQDKILDRVNDIALSLVSHNAYFRKQQASDKTMKLSDKILKIATWLENSDNELLSEASEEQIDVLALSLVHAANTLREAAGEIAISEPATESVMTDEKLEEIAAVAASFDESGDELLQKQAAVLDDILLTLSAPKDYNFNFKKAEDDKLDTLKKKYKDTKEELDENIGTKEALDALKKSPTHKQYRPLEAPLSARTCLDHPGAQMARIADNTWQCSLDHKVYNYETGFTTLQGDKVGGGSVSEQTPKFNPEGHQLFDDRDGRLGIHRE